ncbi:MAG: polynucleotide adenylyltransferase PcnB [Parachlamydiaceae bacterium]
MQPTIYHATDHDIDHHLIDPDALYVIEKLRQAGFKAYLVGGSVRDLLLKREPKDFDISTSAWPEQVKKTFGRQCLLIGRRFRLAHIRFGAKIIEVATFRAGDNESDLITHDNVWGTEEEDVLRRDFTINGLFYDPLTHTVIDYVGGWNDIHEHVIQTIGHPEVRFKQDPVRMIRLLKFQARFGFIPKEETYKALLHSRHEIVKSSPARVLEEMLRMLESCHSASFFKSLHETGILELLFTSLSKVFPTERGHEILQFLEVADQINRRSPRFPIERAVLVCCLIFPLLEEELKKQHLNKGHVPHLGEILTIISDLHRTYILSAFSHFPRRLSAVMSYVLSTQYRLIPFKNKKIHFYRLFRTKEFPLALRLLKIRASIHHELQPQYIQIRESFRQFLRNEESRARQKAKKTRDSHAVSR